MISLADYNSGQITIVGSGEFSFQCNAQAIADFCLTDDFVGGADGANGA